MNGGVLYTEVKSVRRNLNVDMENEIRIQRFRAACLGAKVPIDVDYTTALNLFIALGEAVLNHPPIGPDGQIPDATPVTLISNQVTDIMNKYFERATEKDVLDQIMLLMIEQENRRKLQSEVDHVKPELPRIVPVKPDPGK